MSCQVRARRGSAAAFAAVALAAALSGCASIRPEPELAPGFGLNDRQLASVVDELALAPGTAVLVGAGDIARCDGLAAAAATADLVEAVLRGADEARVFTTGDHAYQDGTPEEFEHCYGPTWGRFNALTRPTPGNHDYETDEGEPYFDYFEYFEHDPEARSRGGYYSVTLGGWHVVALNSLLPLEGGSDQLDWLERDLAEAPTECTVAYWHHPLFSSGFHGLQRRDRGRDTEDVWRVLSAHGAELVVNGHEHIYERFEPQNRFGERDEDGLRQFVVGTGGGRLTPILFRRANSAFAFNEQYGVLVLMLNAGSYGWAFVGTDGAIRDRSDSPVACHAPSGGE